MDYPDEPWDLHGHGYVSLWLVPVRSLPALPPEVTAVSLFGKAIVATAFVDYLPGSLLPYHELLAGVLVRQGRRVGLSITDIWVDSPTSRDGGRELWGIPKELAEFKLVHEPTFTGTASDSSLLAEAEVRPVTPGLPLPFPVTGTVLQTLHDELARTPVRARGRIRWANGRWRTAGSLSWLTGNRPFATVKAEDFELRFGPRAR
ncbi:acetoacetate decarboxylase [Amycolatopsis acidicola]|uniref:Acetoacetate decarboxylase n=1 Tax=Amycolatopsis acidicola TaxID=2596893 RepID=A0A5N0V5S8_9PSEU|nr:acetoacetate decarboxylase family protein [Amycolatopsis acidicola]KAA9161345.1 acetoacetate decarboxylase [Amycolatopsis acidicola]